MNKLIITSYNQGILTAEYENDKIMSLNFETPSGVNIDDIYLGRVDKISENIDAAFIDIGGTVCYMSLSKKQKIKVGDMIPVQVKTEAIKTKSYEVSDRLSIPGRYVVVTEGPYSLQISAKLDYDERRFSIAQTFDSTFSYDDEFSFVLRTNSKEATEEEILNEAYSEIALIKDIRKQATYMPNAGLLHSGNTYYLTKLRDLSSDREVVTDIADVFNQIKTLFPNITCSMYEDDKVSLSQLYKIESAISDALSERVWLKSGGYLVISPTEAMTVIDVNTGKNESGRIAQQTYFVTNKEAAEETARQLRLRNISGIVIIDFINMDNEHKMEEIVSTLKRRLKEDPIPAAYADVTKLGLVELTRKKVYKPLKEQIK